MGSFDCDKLKSNSKAMRNYNNNLRNFGNLVRAFEVCVVVLIISWSSNYFPIAVEISGHFVREFNGVVFSTTAIFVIGNVIVLTLVAQSGKKHDGNAPGKSDIYEEYIRNREIHKNLAKSPEITNENRVIEQSGNLTDEKIDEHHLNEEMPLNVIPESKSPEKTGEESDDQIISSENAAQTEMISYRRTQSENFDRAIVKSRKVIRRSETRGCRKIKSSGEKTARLSCAVDSLSNEEFQRTIEAFIEKQQRLLRQECLAVRYT